MVQKFVKKLNDIAKQSDRSGSAEHTATEQVETTAREIVHEAVQLPRRVIQRSDTRESTDSSTETRPPYTPESPRQRTDTPRTRSDAMQPQRTSAPSPPEQPRSQHTTVTTPTVENTPRQRTEDIRTRPEPQRPQSKPIPAPQERGRRAYAKRTKKSRAEKPSARDHLHTEQPEIRLADSAPQKEIPAIREKPDAPDMRGQVQSEAAQEKPSTVRHVKQPGAWTPRSSAAPVMRGKEQSIRERSAVTQAHDLPPVPQAQARQAFIEKQAQLSRNPSIESIYPPEPAAPVPPQFSRFGCTCDHAEAPVGHGRQQQIGPTCPAVGTDASSIDGAAARHPRKTETKRRTERKIPARRFYSDNRYGTNQHAKGAAKNTCIKNRCKAGTEISYTGCTAKNAPKGQ